jgi:hypothetical protein
MKPLSRDLLIAGMTAVTFILVPAVTVMCVMANEGQGVQDGPDPQVLVPVLIWNINPDTPDGVIDLEMNEGVRPIRQAYIEREDLRVINTWLDDEFTDGIFVNDFVPVSACTDIEDCQDAIITTCEAVEESASVVVFSLELGQCSGYCKTANGLKRRVDVTCPTAPAPVQ